MIMNGRILRLHIFSEVFFVKTHTPQVIAIVVDLSILSKRATLKLRGSS